MRLGRLTPPDFSWNMIIIMTRMMPRPSILHLRNASALCAGLLLPFFAGCRKDSDITVYRIPKDSGGAPNESSAVPPNAAPDADSAPASVGWTLPAGWQEEPATGFLKGSFTVAGAGGQKAEVSVVSLPAADGGLLADVNRMRDRLQLPPITEDGLTSGSMLPVDGQKVYFVDLVSGKALPDGSKARTLNGILSLPGETWFFKMSGSDKLVEAQRNSFRQFLQSLKISAASGGTPAMADMNSPNAASVEAPPALVESPPAPPIQYQLPAGWKEKPLTPMRVASFRIPGGTAGDADASIVMLSGEAGGELENVNRWRGQIGLEAIGADALDGLTTHVDAGGHDFVLVDLLGTQSAEGEKSKERILAATLTENTRSWFIKMTGPDAVVEAQRGAFIGLLKSLTLPP